MTGQPFKPPAVRPQLTTPLLPNIRERRRRQDERKHRLAIERAAQATMAEEDLASSEGSSSPPVAICAPATHPQFPSIHQHRTPNSRRLYATERMPAGHHHTRGYSTMTSTHMVPFGYSNHRDMVTRSTDNDGSICLLPSPEQLGDFMNEQLRDLRQELTNLLHAKKTLTRRVRFLQDRLDAVSSARDDESQSGRHYLRALQQEIRTRERLEEEVEELRLHAKQQQRNVEAQRGKWLREFGSSGAFLTAKGGQAHYEALQAEVRSLRAQLQKFRTDTEKEETLARLEHDNHVQASMIRKLQEALGEAQAAVKILQTKLQRSYQQAELVEGVAEETHRQTLPAESDPRDT
ncbi:unnamed protein product [Vitrella brassicaformis CCMP3155]|uniref:Uncharacterized protein n=1 Tax=Vitrella brassicaformis (strain CCMP3155) TaxID=1169540 RepID=A0A0G4EM58_VITBC|nr:unnamed protein product [Vitrella brassicaformis CCMP3155]|eukprot:CEL98049.1 unnamed protein product [Vitrella brassicaformis CCMP3155]